MSQYTHFLGVYLTLYTWAKKHELNPKLLLDHKLELRSQAGAMTKTNTKSYIHFRPQKCDRSQTILDHKQY